MSRSVEYPTVLSCRKLQIININILKMVLLIGSLIYSSEYFPTDISSPFIFSLHGTFSCSYRMQYSTTLYNVQLHVNPVLTCYPCPKCPMFLCVSPVLASLPCSLISPLFLHFIPVLAFHHCFCMPSLFLHFIPVFACHPCSCILSLFLYAILVLAFHPCFCMPSLFLHFIPVLSYHPSSCI